MTLTFEYFNQWQADLRVLNTYPQIQSFSAFNSIYNNTGLFGIQATTVSQLFELSVIGIDMKIFILYTQNVISDVCFL